VVVSKKPNSQGNKRWIMVIDFRALNEKMIRNAYPFPNIIEILDQLGSAKYFSVLDLSSGFHQILMHESDVQKTAFSTSHEHYYFQSNVIQIKEHVRHVPKTHGSGIIRIIRERYVRLF